MTSFEKPPQSIYKFCESLANAQRLLEKNFVMKDQTLRKDELARGNKIGNYWKLPQK